MIATKSAAGRSRVRRLNSMFSLINLKFFIHNSFVCLLAALLVFKYSQDRIPQNNAPPASQPRCLCLTLREFNFMYLKTIRGRAHWFVVLGSSLSYEFRILVSFKAVFPETSAPGSPNPLILNT